MLIPDWLAAATLATSLAIAAPPVLAHGDAHAPKMKADTSLPAEEHAFGREGDPAKVTRTIAIEMRDTMRYSPSEIAVAQGETVRFVVKNNGKMLHEIVIGTMDELKAHGELMKKNPGMEHDEPYMAHVRPGGAQELVWQFTRAGEFSFGCLAPGHFEAGMTGEITVLKAPMSDGEIRKVDREAGKITIKHGELKNLDMPPMTMVFRVSDPAMLGQVKAGDRIAFVAGKVDGQFTVMQVEVKR